MARKRKPSRGAVPDMKDAAQESLSGRSRSPSVNPVWELQRTIGNRAVTEMLAPAQKEAKVRVSQPGEPAEVEADRIAHEVAGRVKPGDRGSESGVAEPQEVSAESLAGLGPGEPIDETVRRAMEAQLGHDFSGVRIHTGSQAAGAAQSLNARAYTTGQEIVFGAGEYAPQTQAGKQLIAHELTHVAQQGAARPIPSRGKQQVTSGAQVSAGKVIQRQPAAPTGTGSGTSQPAPQPPPQLTQALYDKAIAILATLSGVDPAVLAILKRGKVGKRVAGVKLVTAPPPTANDPAVKLTCDLEISPVTGGMQQGAAAQFIEDPANQTTVDADPAKGISITRLLKIIAKPAASDNEMAWSLLHEGMHMLLAIDRMLQQFAGVAPGLSSGLTGAMKTFSQYQQANKKSSKRAALVAGLVKEIDRVQAPAAPAAPTPSSPKPGSPAPAPSPSSPPPAAAPSSADIAEQTIDMILEERFAFDQQLKQFPGSKKVANSLLADAYMFDELAFVAGLKSWPTPPNRPDLVKLMAAFLDDVELILNPPAPPTTKPTPPAQPKKP